MEQIQKRFYKVHVYLVLSGLELFALIDLLFFLLRCEPTKLAIGFIARHRRDSEGAEVGIIWSDGAAGRRLSASGRSL